MKDIVQVIILLSRYIVTLFALIGIAYVEPPILDELALSGHWLLSTVVVLLTMVVIFINIFPYSVLTIQQFIKERRERKII